MVGVLALITMLTGAAVAQPKQRLPLEPGIKTGKLDNGFTYFIRKNTEPQRRAVLYLVVKAGSVLETERQRGLAHFMEHMSFNGTKNYPKNTLVDYLEKNGVRFGSDLNAYTAFDETVYQLPVPTDNALFVNNCLKIMRDWATEATLDQDEINKERGVVLEEKRLGKGLRERLHDKIFPFEVNGSRYASRLPIGTDSVLNHFRRADILSFYKTWYRPDLQALIVVGDVDIPQTEGQIRKIFANLTNPKPEKVRTNFTARLLNKSRFLVVTDPELTETNLELSFKTTELPQGTREDYRNSLLRDLCLRLLGERLSDFSKTPGAPVLDITAGRDPIVKGLEATKIRFTAKNGDLKSGFSYVYRALLQALRFGFTDDEIDRAKTVILDNMRTLVREKDRQSSGKLTEELKRHFTTGEPVPGIVYEERLVREMLPKFNSVAILQELKRLLNNTNRDIVLTAPDSKMAQLPSEQDINSWINTIEKEQLIAYVSKITSTALLTDNPVAGKIVGEEHNDALGTTTWALANGAKVILKPTPFKNDEIIFHVFSPGGYSLYSTEELESAQNAAGMMSGFGLGVHDAFSLPKLLSGKHAYLTPYVSSRWEGFRGGSNKADLETALQLLYLSFTAPRTDSSMFREFIGRSEQRIANRNHDPESVLQDSITAVFSNYSPRRTPPNLEKLSQITLEGVSRIYKERFADASDFTFVFTGSFSEQAIRPLVERYIASLPAKGRREEAADEGVHLPEGIVNKTFYGGKADKASVMLVYHGDYHATQKIAESLEALRAIVQLRMTQRLRENEGGAYSPGVSMQLDHFKGDRYAMIIGFGCAPQNANHLINAASDEIERLITGGVTPQEMEKYRTEAIRQVELDKESNKYWLDGIVGKLQNEKPLEELLHRDEMIRQLTATDVLQAARQFIDSRSRIAVISLPAINQH